MHALARDTYIVAGRAEKLHLERSPQNERGVRGGVEGGARDEDLFWMEIDDALE